MAAVLIAVVSVIVFFAGKPDFLFDDISSVYILMLLRSLGFAFFQALASAMLASVAAFLIAFSTTTLSPRWKTHAMDFLRIIGVSLFFAPTLVASLTYLKWTIWIDGLPKFGWFSIITVHVALNVFFLAHAFAVVMNDELKKSLRLIDVSQVYGLSRFRMYIALWRRPLGLEFYRWLPLVFWWSFSAFTTVLVLGGGPRFSSPEVLLFYLLGAGDRPARLLILIMLQALIGVGALYLVRLRQKKIDSHSVSYEAPRFDFCFSHSWPERLMALIGMLVGALFLSFWFPAFLQAFLSFRVDLSVLPSLLRSWAILWRALALGGVGLTLGFVFGRRFSKYLALSLVVSPMVLVSVLFQGTWFFSQTEDFKLWVTAALCLWSTIPMMALWIFSKQHQFLNNNRDLIKIFKPTSKFRMRFFYFPLLALPIVSYFQILILSVLGDVGFVSTVLGSSGGTLAQNIYSKVASYQFDAGFLMFGYLMMSMLPIWILLAVLRRKNEIDTI